MLYVHRYTYMTFKDELQAIEDSRYDGYDNKQYAKWRELNDWIKDCKKEQKRMLKQSSLQQSFNFQDNVRSTDNRRDE